MNCRNPMLLLAVLLTILLAGCASGYKQFYQPAQGATPERIAAHRASAPPANPIVERAQPGNSQAITDAYMKRGYVVIGSAMFNSGTPESEQSAVIQGKDVGADLVLILNPQYTGSVTSSIPIITPTSATSYSTGTATAYGPGGVVNAYGSGMTTTYGSTTNYIPITVNRSNYGAVYFVKQRFGLGVFARDLNEAERQELQSNKGAAIRVVVDGTPAFNADMLVGDIVVGVDGVGVVNANNFTELLRERAGQHTSISIVRRGQRFEKSVQLNP